MIYDRSAKKDNTTFDFNQCIRNTKICVWTLLVIL